MAIKRSISFSVQEIKLLIRVGMCVLLFSHIYA